MQATQIIDGRRLGCSDLPVPPGIDPFREPVDLWARMVHGLEPVYSAWVEEAGDMGKRLEEAVAVAGCERKLGLELPVYRPPSILLGDWKRYSLDFVAGLVDMGDRLHQVTANPRIVECKVRTTYGLAAGGWGKDGTSDVGERELLQVQGQMHAIRQDRDSWLGTNVPELDQVDVFVLVDGQHIHHHPVRYDPELASLTWEAAERFVRDFVKTGTPPPLLYQEGTSRELRRRHPRLGGKVVAGPEAEAIARELTAARERRKALEKDEKELKRKLCEIAGDANQLRGEGWTFAQWDEDGPLRWSKLLEDLAARAKLDAQAFDALKNQYRGPPVRDSLLTMKGAR